MELGTTNLGTFSISLTVKDIKQSHAFYANFGFEVIMGNEDNKWLILRNGTAIIGLFQGMFDKNTLTFNPTDVRNVQRDLKAKGLSFLLEADDSTTGPAHAMLLDPDGNPILIDQH